MNRFWLFNPYENPDGTPVSRNWLMRRLPSVRLHHIVRPDDAGPLHDHPWNARTLILQGCYVEYYENPDFDPMLVEHAGNLPIAARLMSTGDSRVIRYGEFHRIARVSVNPPLLTLFLTYGYRGPWGFKVDGKKVHWRKYLGLRV